MPLYSWPFLPHLNASAVLSRGLEGFKNEADEEQPC